MSVCPYQNGSLSNVTFPLWILNDNRNGSISTTLRFRNVEGQNGRNRPVTEIRSPKPNRINSCCPRHRRRLSFSRTIARESRSRITSGRGGWGGLKTDLKRLSKGRHVKRKTVFELISGRNGAALNIARGRHDRFLDTDAAA